MSVQNTAPLGICPNCLFKRIMRFFPVQGSIFGKISIRQIHLLRGFLFLSFLFLCVEKATAQDLLQTDRPDQTEGVFVVGKKTLQVETGFYAGKNRDQTHNYLIPTALIKFGIAKNLELQSLIDIININGDFGLSPVALGFKANFLKEKKNRPEISLIGRIQVKELGSKEYQINRTLSMFRIAFQNTVSDLYVVGYNVGMQWNEFEKPSYVMSVSNNFNLSKKLILFAEFFNFTSEETALNPIIDAGFLYSIKNCIILDGAFGKHLNNANNQNYYFTLGFTTRFSFLKSSQSEKK